VELLADQTGIDIVEGEATDIEIHDNRVASVSILGRPDALKTAAVVLTTGTFLRGVIHVGHETTPGGRIGDRPSVALADRLRALGLATGRLKTGTPARLDGRTIDWDRCEQQLGDSPPEPFSI
jgi:NAD/FAD-utilizing enzyme apparently involved in cell division